MAFHCKPLLVSVVALVLVLATSTRLAEAQSPPVQSCASKLVPCFKFLNNSSTPDSDCCDGIKEAVNNELSCLCTIYNTPGVLSSFNVSLPQALGLSQRCGVSADVSRCNASSPTASVPPGTPGSDNGSAGRVAWTGISSLLLFWASMLLY